VRIKTNLFLSLCKEQAAQGSRVRDSESTLGEVQQQTTETLQQCGQGQWASGPARGTYLPA
jgi:hypothetical protein